MINKQAVVVVHGMGEQRPGQILRPFSEMMLSQEMEYFSRPTLVGDSFESRYHHVPKYKANGKSNGDIGAETDVYEYHWSYRMKDNRLKDLGAVAYRTLLPTLGFIHLFLAALLLAAALGLAGVLREAWTLPQWFSALRPWLVMPSWLAEKDLSLTIGWPIDFPRVLLVVLIAALAAGLIARFVRSFTGSRLQLFVTSTVWISIGLILFLTHWPYTWGEVTAMALLLTALASMFRLTPHGLKVTWAIVWYLIAVLVYGVVLANWEAITAALSQPETLPKVILGGGAVFVLGVILGRIAPWLTTSFVDVVRYLDTSPRSYEVRRDIRKGLVDLLGQLHDRTEDKQYDRILVIAHSLGSYIAYDALATLWFRRTHEVGGFEIPPAPDPLVQAQYRSQQARTYTRLAGLKFGLAPMWRISHFLTFGSPMYMAHRLVTKTWNQFERSRDRTDFLTCPPPNDVTLMPGVVEPEPKDVARREVAAFAVVQWVNVWYPTGIGLFGDPFGGRLASLFGPGIEDRPIRDGIASWVPYLAHAVYTRSQKTEGSTFVNSVLKIVRV